MAAASHINHPNKTDDILGTYTILLHEADSYVSFFKKRCDIEDEYQHHLFRLAARQHETDRKLAAEHPAGLLIPESARIAWQEMSANLQQEAQLRKNWVKRIREDVIEPLERFRSMKERTLNRIREELRSSISEHKEYLATVQRLKKNYDRKCEEVAQMHAMAEAAEIRDRLIEEQRQDWEHVQPRSGPSPTLEVPASSSMSPPGPRRSIDLASPSRPPVIISGATSSALRDTATPPPANPLQAKGTDVLQALRSNTNNLIQRLNSRKEIKTNPSFPTSNPNEEVSLRPSALRGAKVRREAEDADRDYRKGIFHLETLRLRKELVIRGARRATEDMVYETAGEAKESFAYYIDETRIAAVSRISICDHAQHLVTKINPENDARIFCESEPEEYHEPKVLYENAFTGPCQSLLFGVAINDYCASNPGRGWVPQLVKMCIEEIEKRGMRMEGIYRISGKLQSVTQLVHEIEKDEDSFKFDPDRHDIYTIAGVLKLYLRQLPQPLFPFPLAERVSFTNQLEEQRAEKFKMLAKRIRKLPPAHQATLKLVCEHLDRVASYSQDNKMTPSNLGLVFAPVVFLDEGGSQQLPAQAWKDSVMEVLIENHQELFQGLPTAEQVSLERSRSQRGSMVSRTLSPSARKSLEADRFESYSRSVSPQRVTTPPGPVETPLSGSSPALSAEPACQKPAGKWPGPQTGQAMHSPSGIEQTIKRTFSLRRKSSRSPKAVQNQAQVNRIMDEESEQTLADDSVIEA